MNYSKMINGYGTYGIFCLREKHKNKNGSTYYIAKAKLFIKNNILCLLLPLSSEYLNEFSIDLILYYLIS